MRKALAQMMYWVDICWIFFSPITQCGHLVSSFMYPPHNTSTILIILAQRDLAVAQINIKFSLTESL